MSRTDQLLKTSARIFNDLIHENARNGERILRGKLDGPLHTSYWPNKARDVAMWSSRPVSMEIPLEAESMKHYTTTFKESLTVIPVSLHHVARENITEWRQKRGLGLKKGEAKVTATNMGKKR